MKGFLQDFGRVRPMIAQIVTAALVATVISTWHSADLGSQARAEPRRITPQEPDQHFKSGGRLSEQVLQEILVVLKRIDERLERLEKFADPTPASARAPVTSSTRGEDERLPDGSQIQVRRSR